jgi:hypothetical protein
VVGGRVHRRARVVGWLGSVGRCRRLGSAGRLGWLGSVVGFAGLGPPARVRWARVARVGGRVARVGSRVHRPARVGRSVGPPASARVVGARRGWSVLGAATFGGPRPVWRAVTQNVTRLQGKVAESSGNLGKVMGT